MPFTTLSGLVDADRYHDVGILFPAVWRERDFTGVLERGTPVAQCFLVRREPVELVFAALDASGVAQYDATAGALLGEAGVYRKRFRAPRSRAVAQHGAELREIEP